MSTGTRAEARHQTSHGWSNDATHALAAWIDNDEETYKRVQAEVKEIVEALSPLASPAVLKRAAQRLTRYISQSVSMQRGARPSEVAASILDQAILDGARS